MFLSILRVMFGFLVASIVAGATQVGFALGPSGLVAGGESGNRAVEWVLLAATHSAVFAAPFALIAASISEWQSLRSGFFHAGAGIAVAMAGFAAQYQGEVPGQPSIVNTYAAVTYVATGLLAGLAYWLSAGRWAGENPTPLEKTASAAQPEAG